jgi:hypothetical protein
MIIPIIPAQGGTGGAQLYRHTILWSAAGTGTRVGAVTFEVLSTSSASMSKAAGVGTYDNRLVGRFPCSGNWGDSVGVHHEIMGIESFGSALTMYYVDETTYAVSSFPLQNCNCQRFSY